jgi:fluoride exporter
VITVALFAACAAAGAAARAEAGRRWNRHEGLPLGILAVNVVGAFLLGLLDGVGPPAVTVLGVGGLGGFTTFSSFARDVVALVEEGMPGAAAAYLAATMVAGICAAAAGVALATL